MTTILSTTRFHQLLSAAVSLLAMLSLSTHCHAQHRLLGGDLSLLPSYEEQRTVYRDFSGQPIEPLSFLRQQGWNAVRLRLFVEPQHAPKKHQEEGVCQDVDYVLSLAKRAKAAGYQLMLDFHYSDYWADPAKQTVPHLWQNTPPSELADSVYHYTRRVLQRFAHEGVAPELIQVGNEISFGMLWPTGRIDPLKDEGWSVLARLLAHGSKACREVCPTARIIIHTERAGQWLTTKSYYQHLQQHAVDYDVIGLSYYPMWHGTVSNLGKTLSSLAELFPDKQVMIVETAAYYSHDNDRWATPDQYAEFYPISPEGQEQFTRELMAELSRHANVTGVFWWFPEENAHGNTLLPCWINRGLFDNHTGRALPALKAFHFTSDTIR